MTAQFYVFIFNIELQFVFDELDSSLPTDCIMRFNGCCALIKLLNPLQPQLITGKEKFEWFSLSLRLSSFISYELESIAVIAENITDSNQFKVCSEVNEILQT